MGIFSEFLHRLSLTKIEDLKEEIKVLRGEVLKRDTKIERLTARIRDLERLMRNYGIDPNCGEEKIGDNYG